MAFPTADTAGIIILRPGRPHVSLINVASFSARNIAGFLNERMFERAGVGGDGPGWHAELSGGCPPVENGL